MLALLDSGPAGLTSFFILFIICFDIPWVISRKSAKHSGNKCFLTSRIAPHFGRDRKTTVFFKTAYDFYFWLNSGIFKLCYLFYCLCASITLQLQYKILYSSQLFQYPDPIHMALVPIARVAAAALGAHPLSKGGGGVRGSRGWGGGRGRIWDLASQL